MLSSTFKKFTRSLAALSGQTQSESESLEIAAYQMKSGCLKIARAIESTHETVNNSHFLEVSEGVETVTRCLNLYRRGNSQRSLPLVHRSATRYAAPFLTLSGLFFEYERIKEHSDELLPPLYRYLKDSLAATNISVPPERSRDPRVLGNFAEFQNLRSFCKILDVNPDASMRWNPFLPEVPHHISEEYINQTYVEPFRSHLANTVAWPAWNDAYLYTDDEPLYEPADQYRSRQPTKHIGLQ